MPCLAVMTVVPWPIMMVPHDANPAFVCKRTGNNDKKLATKMYRGRENVRGWFLYSDTDSANATGALNRTPSKYVGLL